MKTGAKRCILLSTAALLIAAAELAVLFTWFLPSPFPARPLRFDADGVTEIVLLRERREGLGTVTDCVRVTEPDELSALCGAFRTISLREQAGHRWQELAAAAGRSAYTVCVTGTDGTKEKFAFGGDGLLLRETGSPFSTEARESMYYRCDCDALEALCEPYFRQLPGERLSAEELAACRPSLFLLKEAEYEYGSFGWRQ